jgi:hypothetical protein
MIGLDLGLLLLGCLGHAALWIGWINRLHGFALPRTLIKLATIFLLAGLAIVPLGYLAALVIFDLPWFSPSEWSPLPRTLRVYGMLSVVVGVFVALRFVWRLRPHPGHGMCRILDSQRVYPADRLDKHPVTNPLRRAMTRIPGNQVLELEIVEKTLEVPRLPPALDGLVIAHLTDLHYDGGISQAYFQEIVRLTNELRPDLVAVTGDLVDKVACIDWIPDTLGRLEAPQGVYAILGNHDVRVKQQLPRLRKTLTDAGMVDLGRSCHNVVIAGVNVLLAGNELPWIRNAGELPDHSASGTADPSVRVLLAHSPDQFHWARQRDFDLMLAGHTHGGQIRVPGVGALLCPSLHGVKYASGTFYVPPTVMHVSRGLSGLDPVRFYCRPELVRLVLRSPTARPEALTRAAAESEPNRQERQSLTNAAAN